MYIWVACLDKDFTSKGRMRCGLSKCKLVIRNISFFVSCFFLICFSVFFLYPSVCHSFLSDFSFSFCLHFFHFLSSYDDFQLNLGHVILFESSPAGLIRHTSFEVQLTSMKINWLLEKYVVSFKRASSRLSISES